MTSTTAPFDTAAVRVGSATRDATDALAAGAGLVTGAALATRWRTRVSGPPVDGKASDGFGSGDGFGANAAGVEAGVEPSTALSGSGVDDFSVPSGLPEPFEMEPFEMEPFEMEPFEMEAFDEVVDEVGVECGSVFGVVTDAVFGAEAEPVPPGGVLRGVQEPLRRCGLRTGRDDGADWAASKACEAVVEVFAAPVGEAVGPEPLADSLLLDDALSGLFGAGPSAWATPGPLTKAAPTPRVTAPAPSQP